MAEGRVLFRFFPIVVDGLGPVELVYKFFVHHMFHPKRGDSRKRALPAHSESRLVESQDYFDDTKRNTRASAQDWTGAFDQNLGGYYLREWYLRRVHVNATRARLKRTGEKYLFLLLLLVPSFISHTPTILLAIAFIQNLLFSILNQHGKPLWAFDAWTVGDQPHGSAVLGPCDKRCPGACCKWGTRYVFTCAASWFHWMPQVKACARWCALCANDLISI